MGPTMAMVTMAPLPLDSPPSPMLASPSRDMPRDMAMDSMSRGLLMLMPTMAMVTMAPLPLDSPLSPMLASPSRDMPRDMAMDSMVITRRKRELICYSLNWLQKSDSALRVSWLQVI